jgi:molybdopterin biosynthesis enzyme
MISYQEAYRLTLEHISPLPDEMIPIADALGRVTAGDLVAQVDSPSADVSLKDGFAVKSQDIESAAPHNPIRLQDEANAGKILKIKPRKISGIRLGFPGTTRQGRCAVQFIFYMPIF